VVGALTDNLAAGLGDDQEALRGLRAGQGRLGGEDP
jgi:hypothetical protein